MSKDEKYVRSAWAKKLHLIEPVPGRWLIHGLDELYDGKVDSWPRTPKANWAAAAEFTRNHLEQVRQLRADWALIGAQAIEWWGFMERADSWTNRRLFWARGFVQFNRILSRLEAELTRLTAGIKPEALENL